MKLFGLKCKDICDEHRKAEAILNKCKELHAKILRDGHRGSKVERSVLVLIGKCNRSMFESDRALRRLHRKRDLKAQGVS